MHAARGVQTDVDLRVRDKVRRYAVLRERVDGGGRRGRNGL